MTRINCVPVTELTDKHLVAEYRELPRIFGRTYAYQERGGNPASLAVHGQPKEYVLGKGHVIFFYTRLKWCVRRFFELVEEMQRRGFKPQYTLPPIVSGDCRLEWYGDWEVTPEALAINRARIEDRLNGR